MNSNHQLILAAVLLAFAVSSSLAASRQVRQEEDVGTFEGGQEESFNSGAQAGFADASGSLIGGGKQMKSIDASNKIGSKGSDVSIAGANNTVQVLTDSKNDGIFGPLKPFTDFFPLFLNPLELIKSIALFFKLDLDKFIELIGKSVVFGIEGVLSPVLISVKIIEGVFVPDDCRLRLFCKIGANFEFFKSAMLTFSPGFIEGSAHFKAITEGIYGKSCEIVFPGCGEGGLRLKEKFKEARLPGEVSRVKLGGRYGI